MLRQLVSHLAVLGVLAPVVVHAQEVDLSGTWSLDEEQSRVRAEATLAGLIGAGAPRTLHITQPSNGTVVVESQINESYARLYVPGEKDLDAGLPWRTGQHHDDLAMGRAHARERRHT